MIALAGALAVSGLVAVPSEPAAAESNAALTRVQVPGTWFTFVRAGERFHSSFTTEKDAATGAPMKTRIVVAGPNGEREVCEEVYAAGGTCAFTSAPQTEDGVWSVEMEANGERPPSNGFGRNQMSWTVEARSAADTPVTGRTWTESFAMEDRRKLKAFSLWYQTEYGYTYSIDFSQFRGINSRFDANAFGNVNAQTCASAYQSVAAGVNNPQPDYRSVTATDCDFAPDKIFFAEPDATMPRQVELPGGGSTWLMVPLERPEVTLEAFTPTVMGSRSGRLDVTVSHFEGNAELLIDTNADGVFDEAGVDRVETVAVFSKDGTGHFDFDGLDGAGNAIPTTTPLAFRVRLDKLGEVHFLLADVEELDGGLVVTRHNGVVAGADDTTVHWNDAPLNQLEWDRQAKLKCGVGTEPVAALDGKSSAGGVRGWTAAGCAEMNGAPGSVTNGGSWGNNRGIDTWAYEHVDEADPIEATRDLPGFKIEKSASPAAGSVVAPGETITYSVLASPIPYPHPDEITPGQAIQHWTGRFSDDLTGVLDDAEPFPDPAALTVSMTDADGNALPGDPTDVSATVAPGNALWTWNGRFVPMTTAVKSSYAVRVSDLDAETGLPRGDGHLLNVAFAHDTEAPPPFPEACVENNTATCGSTEHLVPALRIEKSSDPIRESSVLPGASIDYTLEFQNGGAADVTVEHQDWLEGVLDDAVIDEASIRIEGEGALTFDFAAPSLRIDGTLGAGETATVHYTVTVRDPHPGDGAGDGVLTNALIPAGETPPEQCDDGDLSCTTHFVPSVALDKRFDGGSDGQHPEDWEDLDGSGSISLGDLVGYRFTVTNTGPVPLVGLRLSDPMLEASGVGVSCDGDSLAPGASLECHTTAGYEISAEDVAAGKVLNEATVRGVSEFDAGAEVTATDTAELSPVPAASSIALVKSLQTDRGELPAAGGEEAGGGVEDLNGNGHIDAGDRIWYAFTVENTGETQLTDIAVLDERLAAADIDISCDALELTPGASTVCRAEAGWEITEAEHEAGEVVNVATASGHNPTTGEAKSEESKLRVPTEEQPVIPGSPALSLVKEVASISDPDKSGTVTVGDGIVWSFTLTNIGDTALEQLAVDDPLLTGAAITIACKATELEAGAKTTCVSAPAYTITAADLAAGEVRNKALAAGNDPNEPDVSVESDPSGTRTPVVEASTGPGEGGTPETPGNTNPPAGTPDPDLPATGGQLQTGLFVAAAGVVVLGAIAALRGGRIRRR